MRISKAKADRENIFILLKSNDLYERRCPCWETRSPEWRERGKKFCVMKSEIPSRDKMPQSLTGTLRIFNLDLLSKKNPPKCLKQGRT
jgi:hypothetical protein